MSEVIELPRGGQTHLVQQTGKSKAHIWYVLNRQRIPSKGLAQAIAEYIGVPVKEVFPDLEEEGR